MTRCSRGRRLAGSVVGLFLALLVAGCGYGDSGAKDSAAASKVSDEPSVKVSAPAEPQHEPTKGPNGGQGDLLANLAGNTAPGCVAVGKERDVRSGNMGAGPFAVARAKYSAKSKASRQVALYFIPAQAARLKGITVTGTNESTRASFTEKSKRVSDAEQWKFFQLKLDVPAAGTWKITAESGLNKGCWVVDLA